jgi:outer membrane protein OmpA-like peptidoglycan-associated protein
MLSLALLFLSLFWGGVCTPEPTESPTSSPKDENEHVFHLSISHMMAIYILGGLIILCCIWYICTIFIVRKLKEDVKVHHYYAPASDPEQPIEKQKHSVDKPTHAHENKPIASAKPAVASEKKSVLEIELQPSQDIGDSGSTSSKSRKTKKSADSAENVSAKTVHVDLAPSSSSSSKKSGPSITPSKDDDAAKRKAAKLARIDAIDKLEKSMVNDLKFVQNQDSVTPESLPTVDSVAAVLREYPELMIHIDSHTNCSQSTKFNCDEACRMFELSQRRADNVKHMLISRGCQNVIVSKGWGCKHPQIGNKRIVKIYPEDLEHEVDGIIRDPSVKR